jgi:protein gp37
MSNIEWTDETWTPVKGCTRASEGCDNCYAVRMTHRLEAMGQSKYAGLTVLNPRGERHFNGVVRCDDDALTVPLRWKKPRKVFVSSMSDIFHKDVPFEFVDRVFAVMALCPQHTFQVLTKRPERMAEYLSDGSRRMEDRWGNILNFIEKHAPSEYAKNIDYPWPLPNVWLGTSVENQEQADKRIPHLLKCPAVVRFLSCEPLLGAIRLPLDHGTSCDDAGCEQHRRRLISWVIAGGESGPGARPCRVAWIRSIVAQCKDAGVPVFVKQLGRHPYTAHCEATGGALIDGKSGWLNDPKGGDPAEWPEDLRVREMPEAARRQP